VLFWWSHVLELLLRSVMALLVTFTAPSASQLAAQFE